MTDPFPSNASFFLPSNADVSSLKCIIKCSLFEVVYNDLALPFFIERYQKAYINQFSEFLDVIKKNKRPIASFDDGRNALIIANAAYKSLENKKSIDISFE